MIDWTRLAFPQPDGYDAETALRLGADYKSALPIPYSEATATRRFACGGGTEIARIEQRDMAEPHFLPADIDHPNIGEALDLLDAWPEACQLAGQIVDVIQPLLDSNQQDTHPFFLHGSCSHAPESMCGAICATVEDPVGLAQAIVHEMAHIKLRLLGVHFEQADRLIVNPPDKLYPSPVKLGKQRPMTAVFHAEYSFIHVLQLDLRIFQVSADPIRRDKILQLAARNVVRMEYGLKTIERFIETDSDGTLFVGAFVAWARRTIDAANELLSHSPYARYRLESNPLRPRAALPARS